MIHAILIDAVKREVRSAGDAVASLPISPW